MMIKTSSKDNFNLQSSLYYAFLLSLYNFLLREFSQDEEKTFIVNDMNVFLTNHSITCG